MYSSSVSEAEKSKMIEALASTEDARNLIWYEGAKKLYAAWITNDNVFLEKCIAFFLLLIKFLIAKENPSKCFAQASIHMKNLTFFT